ncbi:spore germination protein [Paenibacillus sp. N4]|uniref:GerAB/ArcD/ProY family transporter n=1 Tax=Paenibacillus vietnamensis TaxID=2590547 RepID=UPI001CD1035C|nr:endospore germination permease [Paenibacillus vietnamensis]MCA0755964.1 spore germination protein [Paenibacillus vietnamensis]
MKVKETVSPLQMSTLFFIFMTGSAIINIPGPLVGFAKNGAWVSLLISGAFGFLVLACILYLHDKFPGSTYIDYTKKMLGSWVTALLSVPFILFVCHMASGIVLDMGLFLTTSMMRKTPVFVFNAFTFTLIAFTVRAGIEVMVRMFTNLILIMLFFVFIVLLLSIPNYHPDYIFPIMPDGIKPVMQGAYFSFGFPYAEAFLFTMLLPFVKKNPDKKNNRLNGYMYLALVLNILILILSVVCVIFVSGPIASDIKYSLYMVARMIDFQDIIQRIESVIGMTLIAGSYMKATIALFVLNLVLTRLFRLQDDRLLIFPLALMCLFLSVVLYDSEVQWYDIVSNTWPLWNGIAGILPLFLLTLITAFKGGGKKTGSGGP